MSCEPWREALSDIAAGLPPTAAAGAHLRSCAECRDELDSLRHALAHADRAMSDLLAEQPSPALAARIRQAASGPPARARLWDWLTPPTAVVTSAGLVAVVGLVAAGLLRTPPGVAPSPRSSSTLPGGPATPSPSERADDGARRAAGHEPSQTAGTAAQSRTPASSSPPARPTERPRPARPSGVEVLVPPGGVEALLRFAADLQTRPVPPDSLLVRDLSAPLAEPTAVEIAPLAIIPLDPTETSGTD